MGWNCRLPKGGEVGENGPLLLLLLVLVVYWPTPLEGYVKEVEPDAGGIASLLRPTPSEE